MKSIEELKLGTLYTVLQKCAAIQYVTQPIDSSTVKMGVKVYMLNKNVPFMVTEIKTLEDSPRLTPIRMCMMKILVKDNLETCYFTPETLAMFLGNTIELQSS